HGVVEIAAVAVELEGVLAHLDRGDGGMWEALKRTAAAAPGGAEQHRRGHARVQRGHHAAPAPDEPRRRGVRATASGAVRGRRHGVLHHVSSAWSTRLTTHDTVV